MITPASISNDYSGTIVLGVTGLIPGETVRVEKVLDSNRNGQIDAAEPLVLSFTLVDGQVSSVAGVRNTNVPGDDDLAANGQIRCVRAYSASSEFERLVSPYVYRLSSPTGRFTPETRLFTLEGASFPQSVTGLVVAGGTPLPRAAVGLLTATGEFFTGAIADEAGRFSIGAPAGGYQLVGLHHGHVFNFNVAPRVVLQPGQTLTQDFPMVAGMRTVSGRITTAGASAGLAGMLLFFEADNGDFALGFSDAMGEFTVPVTSGRWTVRAAESAVVLHGHVPSDAGVAADTTAGNAPGVAVTLRQGTALIYGTVKDQQGTPLAGLDMFASQESSDLEGFGTTDEAGAYAVAVTDGPWHVGPSSDDPLLANYLVRGADVTVDPGQAFAADLTAEAVTTRLRGTVVGPAGTPVTGLWMIAETGPADVAAQQTGPDGTFDFGIHGGTWQLHAELYDAAARDVVGPRLSFTLGDGQTVADVIYRVRPATAHLSGRVATVGGAPLGGVRVYAYALLGGTNYSSMVRTDSAGDYRLPVLNGLWNVGVSCSDLGPLGYQCAPEQSAAIAAGDQIRHFAVEPLLTTAPHLTSLAIVERAIQFTVIGEAGQRFRVEATTDWRDWSGLVTNTTSTPGGSFVFSEPLATGPGRFYRAVWMP